MTNQVTSELSDRQRRIFLFVAKHIEQRHYAPSIREIAARLGISSTSVVEYNLAKLEAAGLITRAQGIARGMTIRKWPEGLRAE